MKIDEKNKRVEVFLQPEEVSLAIGKGGYNIRLASQLTGYEIDVFREAGSQDEEDVNLDEFIDEIDGWIIDVLKGIGCDTAKSVLDIPYEELLKRTDLEEETVKDILRILESEFE